MSEQSIDNDAFKRALRHWASGVTVVTAAAAGEVHGMTVSAFSSVSADPPLVLVCANRSSKTNDFIRAGRAFAVNILEASQANVSTRFAMAEAETRFQETDWSPGVSGLPLIQGALAHMECEVQSSHEAGSHTVFIGLVKRCTVFSGEPLCYYNGGYATLGADLG